MAQPEGNAARRLIRSDTAAPPADDPAKKIAEQLLASARSGRECRLGLVAPDASTPENTVPATLLRVLALGGDEATPVHDQGVQIRGAYIAGALDLRGATLPFDVSFRNCRFDSQVTLQGARGRTITFDGCRLLRLHAENLRLDGALFMRHVELQDRVRLAHARIDSVLDCSRAKFTRENKGFALSLRHADIGGSVYFSNAVFAGGADLLGARIDGDLVCEAASFDGVGANALCCQSARIAGRLILTRSRMTGCAVFAQSEAGVLMDDGNVWPDGETVLDDFRYHRIAAMAPLDSQTRIAWLKKQPERFLSGESFVHQPWRHLAHVLREQGHYADAARIDMARETLLRKAGLVAQLPSPAKLLRSWRNKERDAPKLTLSQLRLLPNVAVWALHRFYGVFSGYGYRPARVIYAALALWIGFGFLYSYVAQQGGFGPADPLIYQNPAYEHCRPDAPETPSNGKAKIGNWLKCPELPANYTSFSPFAYSADLILPVAKLGQNADWTPLTSGDDWNLGYVTRTAVWIEEILGWAAALTLAAIASGLVKQGDHE